MSRSRPARRLARPVKWTCDRREALLNGTMAYESAADTTGRYEQGQAFAALGTVRVMRTCGMMSSTRA